MSGKKRSCTLRTVEDCNRLLAKVINQLNRDEIEHSKASKLGYLLNILIGSMRVVEIKNNWKENGVIINFEDIEEYLDNTEEENVRKEE